MQILPAIVTFALLAPTVQALAAPKFYIPPPTRKFLWRDVKSAPYAALLASSERQSYLQPQAETVHKALTPLELESLSRITSTSATKPPRSRFSLADVFDLTPDAESYLQSIRKLRLEELSPEYRSRIEEEVIARNIADLQQILQAANQSRDPNTRARHGIDAILTDLEKSTSAQMSSNQLLNARQDEQRKWSYKSGSLVVKGKKGTFEYEQTFSLQGVAGAGFIVGTGIAIVACALSDAPPTACPLDALTFIHGVALPTDITKK
jgi:hypothetical protein